MDQVLAVSFSPFESHQLVTCGKQHVSFWELEDNKLKQSRGRMSVSQLHMTFFTADKTLALRVGGSLRPNLSVHGVSVAQLP